MNLTLVTDFRFVRTPDGAVWTESVMGRSFFQRYLEVFDHVCVVARVKDVAEAAAGSSRINEGGVSVWPLPYFVGPREMMAQLAALQHVSRQYFHRSEALLLRIPSHSSTIFSAASWWHKRPFGVEVVGNPNDAFSPEASQHPLQKVFRSWFGVQQRWQCSHAACAAYVTKDAIQREFPPGKDAYTTHYSSIELGESAFVSQARRFSEQVDRPWHLLSVGSLEQLYKGQDILIDAVAKCQQQGLDVRLRFAGDGKFRGQLEAQVRDLGLEGKIEFLGMLPGSDAVRRALDDCDIFVLPSITEGLPRAVIEAMARGLPCIGSTAGGIPELLPPEDCVPPADTSALADKIASFVRAPLSLNAKAERNLQLAREYHDSVLSARRMAFYTELKRRTKQGE
ncbi:MAG: glycosyltransferase [Myxococcota bacterium]